MQFRGPFGVDPWCCLWSLHTENTRLISHCIIFNVSRTYILSILQHQWPWSPLRSHLRSLIFAPIESTYDFLFVLNSNLGPILLHFRNRAFVCRKPLFRYPYPIPVKISGYSPWCRSVMLGSAKNPRLTNGEIILEEFQPQHYGQTDGWLCHSNTALCIASRGKNLYLISSSQWHRQLRRYLRGLNPSLPRGPWCPWLVLVGQWLGALTDQPGWGINSCRGQQFAKVSDRNRDWRVSPSGQEAIHSKHSSYIKMFYHKFEIRNGICHYILCSCFLGLTFLHLMSIAQQSS